MQTCWRWLLTAVLISGVGTLYAAETAPPAEGIPNHPVLRDDVILALGVFYPRSTTGAALESATGGGGALINFEDALDLEKRSVTASAGIFWRFSDNWRMELEYFKVPRDASRTLASDLEWGDQTFTAGTMVDSTFDFSDLRVSASYAFFKRQDKELGIGLGLHIAGIKTSIQASGVGANASDVTAPLPTMNLYGIFALTDEWAITMRGDWLSLVYGDFSGEIRNIEVNALYQPFRNVGFGLGVRSMIIDLTISDPDWQGQARLSLQGPNAFMTVSF